MLQAAVYRTMNLHVMTSWSPIGGAVADGLALAHSAVDVSV